MNVATLTNSLKALFGTAASSTAIASTDLVPFMNSSGTPSGLSSISQLASVLGGVQKLALLTTSYDIDDIDITSCCIVGSKNTSPHKPSGQTNGTLLTVVTGSVRRVQFWGSDTATFVRQYDSNYSDGWYNWQRVDNFGCSTPTDLASLLGGLDPIGLNKNSIELAAGTTSAAINVGAGILIVSSSITSNIKVVVVGNGSVTPLNDYGNIEVATAGGTSVTIKNGLSDSGTFYLKKINP